MINHLNTLRAGALAAALLAGTSIGASAATITFDFTSSGGTVSGSGYSNQRVYSSGGITLTVTGWSVGASTLDRANVGQYNGGGLGVCSTADGGSSCGDPQHQVDNFGAQEFVLFQFSLPVDPTSVTVNPSSGVQNSADRDVRYYVNSAAQALATIDASLPSALGTATDVANSVGSSGVSVAIGGSTSVYTLLVGAPTITAMTGPSWKKSCPTGGPDCTADYWKIESLTVNYTAAPPPPPPPPGGAGDPVSAPATLALFGAALAGLGVARRRRA